MKSSTHYFDIKTKALADFEICISVTLREANEKTLRRQKNKRSIIHVSF